MKPKLSLATIVKNEARCLARCLQSAKGVVDEIIIADTGSTDDTVKIAEQFGARIFHFKWTDDFSAARNFVLEQAGGEWLLALDGDEWLSEGLAEEIVRFIQGPRAVGCLKQVNDFQRGQQKFRSQCFVPRVFPRGTHYEGRIHEQVVSPFPRVMLRGDLWHDGYLEISQRTARNLPLIARELERNPNDVYFLFQMAVEYNSIHQPDQAFDCLQKASSLVKPGHPLAPNITVDLLYTIIELKRLEQGLEVIVRGEKELADFPDFFLVRGLFFMHLVRSNPARYIGELPKIEQSYRRCLALGEDERRRSVRGSGSFLASYNLGVFYQAFGNAAAARSCLEASAAQSYEPAAALLREASKPVAQARQVG